MHTENEDVCTEHTALLVQFDAVRLKHCTAELSSQTRNEVDHEHSVFPEHIADVLRLSQTDTQVVSVSVTHEQPLAWVHVDAS